MKYDSHKLYTIIYYHLNPINKEDFIEIPLIKNLTCKSLYFPARVSEMALSNSGVTGIPDLCDILNYIFVSLSDRLKLS